MAKILEHASRGLAILGVALIIWAGVGVQTAKGQTTIPVEVKDGWLDPCIPHPANGLCSVGNLCPFLTFCKRGTPAAPITPRLINGVITCCW